MDIERRTRGSKQRLSKRHENKILYVKKGNVRRSENPGAKEVIVALSSNTSRVLMLLLVA